MTKEVWKDISGFEGYYQISDSGRVKSLDRTVRQRNGINLIKGRFLKPSINKGGYEYLSLCKEGSQKTYVIHRLVGVEFVSNPQNKPQINHINGIKTDNRAENLEWVTNQENQQHASKIGLRDNSKGINHPLSKLTEADVLEIRSNILNKSRLELSIEFGVSKTVINQIINRKMWKHI